MHTSILRILAGAACAVLALPAAAQTGAPAATPAPPPAAEPVLGAEAFAEIPFLEGAQLSPDGTRIAGKLGVANTQAIGVIKLADGKRQVAMAVMDGTEVRWVRWVNNRHVLVGLQALLATAATTDRTYISRLISIDTTNAKVTKLLWESGGQNAADVLWMPNDGSDEILVAAQDSFYLDEGFYPTVHRVNVANGRAREALRSRPGIMDWSVDASGTVRMGQGYEDSKRTFRLVYRGEGSKGSFREIDRANTRKDESLLYPFLFLPGGDHALAVRTSDDGREGVYEVDLATMQSVKEIYLAPKGTEIDGTVLSSDGTALLGVSTSEVSGHVHWIDPELAELQAAFDKAVKGSTAHIISLSADRQAMLVKLLAPNTPGSLYYFSRDGGTLVRLAHLSTTIGRRALGPVKVVKYKARDGLEIEAILTTPAGKEAKALPIVMMPHGGPWGQDTASWDYIAQYVASRGYAVLQPNFRGSTGYGAEFTRKGQGQMGLAMQDDISDGLAWAVREGIADPARACIVGASYGGYAAMWGVVKDPDLYRCAISISGVANLRREVNDFGGYFFKGKYTDDWKKMTPDFAAVSPINGIARIKAPLLLIHGRRDVTVDVAQSDSMASKMRAAGKAVEYLPLPKADHYFTRQPDRLMMLNAIGTFLAKNNPVP